MLFLLQLCFPKQNVHLHCLLSNLWGPVQNETLSLMFKKQEKTSFFSDLSLDLLECYLICYLTLSSFRTGYSQCKHIPLKVSKSLAHNGAHGIHRIPRPSSDPLSDPCQKQRATADSEWRWRASGYPGRRLVSHMNLDSKPHCTLQSPIRLHLQVTDPKTEI
jgi:hypothetical protein